MAIVQNFNLDGMKHKSILLIAICSLLLSAASKSLDAQAMSLGPTSVSDGDIYALIIGISDYKHVNDLQFAHRDAKIFADYLQSTAGGSVPKDNIRLLTNEQATIANIYMAKQWLEESAQKDDLVFFYFAGHGDVESSLYKLGFLLAYDTPEENYFNNAVRIEDFNIMANTLSVVNEAKVILITDACHSGKLAGSDNRGNQLVGDQLSTVSSSEVRIASCAAEELSQEDEYWGGGRGAFSYHLVNGLKGLADDPDDEDGIITLFELEDYLEKNVMKEVFKVKREDQTPVVAGKKSTKMALVDLSTLSALRSNNDETDTTFGLGGTRSVSDEDSNGADIYFRDMAGHDFDPDVIHELRMHPKWDLASKVMSLFPYPDAGESNPEINSYLDSLTADPRLAIDFQRRLAATIHDQCQETINAYLATDAQELNRRQYYNTDPQEYFDLGEKLEFAQTLVDEENYLYEMMEVKALYFKGISKRMQYTTTYIKAHLDSAFMKQNLALEIDDRASYVHNELGILHRLNNNDQKAEESWQQAKELTPQWALPWSNLSNLYHAKEQHNKGLAYGKRAVELQADYFMGHTMLARNAAALGDYLTAEEHLKISMSLNDEHYFAYQSLGYLYTNTLDYAIADSFFIAAEWRKAGHNLSPSDADGDGVINHIEHPVVGNIITPPPSDPKNAIDPQSIRKGDATAYCAYAMWCYSQENYDSAQKYFEKTINLQPDHPTAYRYLAEIAYMDKDWMKAEYHAERAVQLHNTYEYLGDYCNSNPPKKNYQDLDALEWVLASWYERQEIQYLYAYLLQQLGRYNSAEHVYREMLSDRVNNTNVYLHLINLHERFEQYERCESVINKLSTVNASQGQNELYAFYHRMIDRDIDTAQYLYKSGLLCYYNIPWTAMIRDDKSDVLNVDWLIDEVEVPTVQMMGSTGEYSPALAGDNTYLSLAEEIGDFNYDRKAWEHLTAIEHDAPDRVRADIFQKLGDIYWHLYHDREQGSSYYAKASELYEKHADLRESLVKYYTNLDLLNDAYHQLVSLHENEQLRYHNAAQLADYAVKSGNYPLASECVNLCRAVQPSRNPGIEKTNILRLLNIGQMDEAIRAVKRSIDLKEDKSAMHYTLARLYSLQGKSRKAVQQINEAIDAGFTASLVLDYDPALGDTRSHRDYTSARDRLPTINFSQEKPRSEW